MFLNLWLNLINLAVVIVLVNLARDGAAEEGSSYPVAIIKISEAALSKLIDQQITQASPVDDHFRGTHLLGQASTIGRPLIVLRDDDQSAAFQVVFNGTTTSHTTGSHRPVTLLSHATTDFSATKRIEFLPGRGFHASPAKIESQTQTHVDSIDTPRRGLLRRFILKRAWAETRASQSAANEFAKESAEAQIIAAFELALEKQLTELNRAADLRTFAEQYFQAKLPPVYQCATQQGYLQLVISSKPGTHCEVKLPKLTGKNLPIQLWLHKSLLGNDINSGIALLESAGVKPQELLKQSVPLLLATELATAITSPYEPMPPTENVMHWSIAEEWLVIQFSGDQLASPLNKVQSTTTQANAANLR